MPSDNKLLYLLNDKVTFEKVNDECCIYNEETDRIAVLNSTASTIFEYLKECLDSNIQISEREIAHYIIKQYNIQNDMLLQIIDDIKMVIMNFKEEKIFIFDDINLSK